MLRSLKHYLRAQNPGHHAIDRLKESSVKRKEVLDDYFSLKGQERAIVNQTNIESVSMAILGNL